MLLINFYLEFFYQRLYQVSMTQNTYENFKLFCSHNANMTRLLYLVHGFFAVEQFAVKKYVSFD